MGVYIPNIKIPEKCSKCRDTGLKFAIDELGLKCPERKEIFGPTEADIKGIRRPDCPLVPVPPHGRLGDLDALAQQIEHERFHHTHTDGLAARHHVAEYGHFLKAISDAPTIIPAEEGEI